MPRCPDRFALLHPRATSRDRRLLAHHSSAWPSQPHTTRSGRHLQGSTIYVYCRPILQAIQPGGGTRMSSRNGVQSQNGIEVNGLVREFKGGVRAVDGIDLEVRPGEIYGFLGPNGAGKSTTVHVLTTLLPPTAGSARVAGHDVVREGSAVREVIGVALQDAALDLLLTGREHMRLQGGLHGLAPDEIARR